MVRLLELLAVLDQRLKVVEGVVQDHEVAVLEVERIADQNEECRGVSGFRAVRKFRSSFT